MKEFFNKIKAIEVAFSHNVLTPDQAEAMVLESMYKQFGNDRLMWALVYFQKLERDAQKKEISKYRTSLQFSAGIIKQKNPTTPEILFYLKGAFPDGTCKGYSQQENDVFMDLVSKLNLSEIDGDWAKRHEMSEYIQLLKFNNYVD
jgi:hypothetical protein